MFIYLSKKIAIPNNVRLRCVGWNKDQGYIACGGDDGLLKVLKLEATPSKDGKASGLAAPSTLSMNQSLEGHSGQIQVVVWNSTHQKLTSSDSSGLIIVWMLYKGSWYEEMINNRNKSVVRGMAWNSDGQKICIVYQDGAVIVGSVDGNRIWGKELKGQHLTGVEWSPDSLLLLFSHLNGEIHVYDNTGNFVNRVQVQCLGSSVGSGALVVGLSWYHGQHGHVEPDCPVLAICYDNGRMQLMRNEGDDMPILIDTGMTVVSAQWNHNGSVIAVAGSLQLASAAEKDCNVVQFYTPFGEHMRTLKVPGQELTGCSWEGRSLRIALAVDSFIYFANIRPDYRWCYFAKTVVYTYTRPDRAETCVTFWDTANNEHYVKYIKYLMGMVASHDHCVLSVRTDDGSGQFGLIICNAIGTPVDSKYIDLEPLHVTMTNNHVLAASKDNLYLWHFKAPKAHSSIETSAVKSDKVEKIYHVDDSPTGSADVFREGDRLFEATSDPVCCLSASERLLLVGRESGTLQRYSLPRVALTARYTLACRPHRLALNSNSTRLAIIDITGLMTLMDLDSKTNNAGGSEGLGDVLKFERKDVWDVCWASDNPEMFALMEKTKMCIFRNMDPEQPIPSSGYLCSFHELEVTAVLLDEVMQDPEFLNADHILTLEAKSLRDTRELLEKVSIKDASSFIDENPHPRLWRLLGEAALEKLDLENAETAFVRCKDYPMIQLVKRVAGIHSEAIRKAEVAAYFKRFEEAEKLYLEVERRDLAVNLRRKLGDWFRVLQLLKAGPAGDDTKMEEALNNIGHHYADRQHWDEAVKHFELAHNHQMLAQCYYQLEDFDSLESLVRSLPEGSNLLPVVADMFTCVGMSEQAVMAYMKCNKVKDAIDTCVTLNQWTKAVELARQHNVTETGGLLGRYAEVLLKKGNKLQAIELYRRADKLRDAAKLLFMIAEEEGAKKLHLMRTKKLYVLAAQLMMEHNVKIAESMKEVGGSRSAALMGMYDDPTNIDIGMATEGENSSTVRKFLDSPWKGAEAYHYLLLAQRQLYEGYVDAAMKTCLHLREFESVLPAKDIFSLLALSSCANRAFATCSKAFIKLEGLPNMTDEERESYEDLALSIFLKYSPKDSRSNRAECTTCETMIPDWVSNCPSCNSKFSTCVVTGRPIMDPSRAWICTSCRHSALQQDITLRSHCPLCHAVIPAQ
uniref:WD repeat-containing protein 35 n=4 Tax=Hirondellea gigas TaxID=1518452 RepID=A0A6A7G3L3_9CRUS